MSTKQRIKQWKMYRTEIFISLTSERTKFRKRLKDEVFNTKPIRSCGQQKVILSQIYGKDFFSHERKHSLIMGVLKIKLIV